MRAWEIHKWLISRKATLRQVEDTLNKMVRDDKLEVENGFFFLGIPKLEQIKSENLLNQSLKIYFLKSKRGVRLISFDGQSYYTINGSKTLMVSPENLDNASRLLSMKVLWQKEKTYFELLNQNSWVFKYFPNWTTALY